MTALLILTCDWCKKDLSSTSNSIDYRLALIVEVVPSATGPVTDMFVFPPMRGNAHFCGLNCLKKWASEQ